jgi:nucleoid-associated protein EbfC
MFGDMMGMMGKMKEVQAKMKEAQESLGSISATGEAGGGVVSATVNGQKKLIDLRIDADLLTPDDHEMLQDLVIAAVNKAMDNVEEPIKKHLQKTTEGLIPTIPGFDLGSFMK